MNQYNKRLDKQLQKLKGPGPARSGDRWPTHRAKSRATRTTKPEETDEEN